jgi:hypothetical protein
MILQMVWNECVRYGGHISIQINYKILQLEISKKAPILHNVLCIQQGLICGSFRDNTAHDV